MCCLGVLCEIYRQEHPETSKWMRNAFFVKKEHEFNEHIFDVLPREVYKWAELGANDPVTSLGSMVELNDEKKYTFEQIAKVIKDEL